MEEVATKIMSEHHCLLGEGCTYDPATDTAWWFDILEQTLFQADLASGAVTSRALPLMASVLAFIDDQRQLLATENGLYVRDVVDGSSRCTRRSKPTMLRRAQTKDEFIPAARFGSGPWAAGPKRARARFIAFIAANCFGSMPA